MPTTWCRACSANDIAFQLARRSSGVAPSILLKTIMASTSSFTDCGASDWEAIVCITPAKWWNISCRTVDGSALSESRAVSSLGM